MHEQHRTAEAPFQDARGGNHSGHFGVAILVGTRAAAAQGVNDDQRRWLAKVALDGGDQLAHFGSVVQQYALVIPLHTTITAKVIVHLPDLDTRSQAEAT